MKPLLVLLVVAVDIQLLCTTRVEGYLSMTYLNCSDQQIYLNDECTSLVDGPCTLVPAENVTTITTEQLLKYNGRQSSESLGDQFGLNESNVSNVIKCVRGAKCVQDGHQTSCKCRADFRTTKEKICVIVLDYSDMCDLDQADMQCDHRKFLRCIEGRCNCGDPLYTYNYDIEKCVGLVGALCGKDVSDDLDYPVSSHVKSCTFGAECYIEFGETIGTCRCDNTTSELINRTCKKINNLAEMRVLGLIVTLSISASLLLLGYCLTRCHNFIKSRSEQSEQEIPLQRIGSISSSHLGTYEKV